MWCHMYQQVVSYLSALSAFKENCYHPVSYHAKEGIALAIRVTVYIYTSSDVYRKELLCLNILFLTLEGIVYFSLSNISADLGRIEGHKFLVACLITEVYSNDN